MTAVLIAAMIGAIVEELVYHMEGSLSLFVLANINSYSALLSVTYVDYKQRLLCMLL
jgi:hypothetical protein